MDTGFEGRVVGPRGCERCERRTRMLWLGKDRTSVICATCLHKERSGEMTDVEELVGRVFDRDYPRSWYGACPHRSRCGASDGGPCGDDDCPAWVPGYALDTIDTCVDRVVDAYRGGGDLHPLLLMERRVNTWRVAFRNMRFMYERQERELARSQRREALYRRVIVAIATVTAVATAAAAFAVLDTILP